MIWTHVTKKLPKSKEIVLVWDGIRFYVSFWVRHPNSSNPIWKHFAVDVPVTHWTRIKPPRFKRRGSIRRKFETGKYFKQGAIKSDVNK